MMKSTMESPSGRHRDLWRGEAVRWIYSEFGSVYDLLLAKKGEMGPGDERGERVESADVPDGAAAIALAHRYLDQHVEEAAGRMSLEIHIRPPETELQDLSAYVVPREIVERARELGVEGDIEAEVKRMARDAILCTHERANLQADLFFLRVERDRVVWIAKAEKPRRRRGKRTI